jgi:dipeptidase E
MTKQIIAAGGDAVTDIPFHYYMLAQSSSEKPKVCLLPTASGDNEDLIRTFYGIMRRHHCELDYLPLFRNKEKNIREFILNQDIILVAGGQSKSMMGVWKEWGVHEYLMEAYDNGTIMAGGSAGSVCWFDECITDSFAGKLAPMPALGFLPYSNCPHYRSDERRAAYKTAILEKRIKPGYAISDDAALHFVDGKLFRGICSEANASSFYVDIDLNGKEPKIRSERIPTSWLGSRAVQEELIWPAPAFKYMIAEQEAEEKKAAEEEQEASRQG